MQPHSEQVSKPSVCRRLFADDPDPADVDDGIRDNVLNRIQEELNQDLDEACKKYNFDFRAEVPLEGNWVWERVVPDPPPERRAVAPTEELPSGSEPAADPGDAQDSELAQPL